VLQFWQASGILHPLEAARLARFGGSMSALRPHLLFAVLLILSGLGSVPVSAQRPTSRKLAAAQPTPQAAPVAPPAPLTLEQMPTTPPEVTYSNGQLTIVAHNSTLADILTAVRNRTGAAVDIPSNATERVVSHLGPGPAREVLAALLNGSHFNYVMLGSPADPTGLDRVILIFKAGGGETASAAMSPSQPISQPSAQSGAPPAAGDDDLSADDITSMDDTTDTDGQLDDTAAEAAQPAQQGPKTPEQLLQELQRQQQGLQQQQQPPGAPPQGFPMPGQTPPTRVPQPQPPQ
jgi:hypothetical protein